MQCGAIKKSDNKPCTNAGRPEHGGRCGVHKDAGRPSSPPRTARAVHSQSAAPPSMPLCGTIKADHNPCTNAGKPQYGGRCGIHKDAGRPSATAVHASSVPSPSMPLCGTIKADRNPCTNAGRPEYGGHCGVHKDAGRAPSSSASLSTLTCGALKGNNTPCTHPGRPEYGGRCGMHKDPERRGLPLPSSSAAAFSSSSQRARSTTGRPRPASFNHRAREYLIENDVVRDTQLGAIMRREQRYQRICAEQRNRDAYTGAPLEIEGGEARGEVEHAWECQLTVEALCRSPLWAPILAMLDLDVSAPAFSRQPATVQARFGIVRDWQNHRINCDYVVSHAVNMRKKAATEQFLGDLARSNVLEHTYEDRLNAKFEHEFGRNPTTAILRAASKGSDAMVDGYSNVSLQSPRLAGVDTRQAARVVEAYMQLAEDVRDLQGRMDL